MLCDRFLDFFGMILIEVQPAVGHIQNCGGHFVLRDGAGFVTADNGNRSQCLHGRQLTNQRVAFEHSPSTDCQRNGGNCGQALRDNRNSKTDRSHQHQFGLLSDRQAGDKHQSDNNDGDNCQSAAEPRQPNLERSRFGFD